MKYCEEYAALLDAYFDGECTPEEAEQVRAHIAVCPGCRAYLNESALLRDAFPDGEDTEVPEGFADGVMAAIRADAAPQKRPHRWKSLLPMAACLAVIVLAANQLPGMMGGGSSSSTAAAPAAAAATDSAAAGTDMTEAYAEARSGETPQFFTAAEEAGENGTSGGTSPAEEKAAVRDAAPAEPASDPRPEDAPAVSAAAVTSVEGENSWLAELTVTAAQAEGLAGDWTLLDSVPEGDRYTLTQAQLENLLARLGDDAPAYEPGEGELALVTVVP